MDDLLAQLDQLHQALRSADDDSKPGIQQLINDIQELLGIVPDSNTSAAGQSLEPQPTPAEEDDEFLKFQAEIAALDASNLNPDSNSNSNESSNKNDPTILGPVSESNENCNGNAETHDIREELKALEGMKCLAPFQANWGQIGYYSGIILCVENTQHDESGDIRVRIAFTQPIVESMRPCEYFLDGRCRFSDGECKFSHGEVVSLSELREYKDPDYSKVVPGAQVLAKYSDGLWYKATVIKITESGDCQLFYQSHKDQIFTIPIHETCPAAETNDEDESNDSDEEADEKDSGEEGKDENDGDEVTSVVFIRVSAATPLGEWEKHTRGIGSKLMAKMGYILGAGLGKNAEGRVNPVDAVVLPPGRSLDRCMELKEKAGSSGANLFSVERRLKRQKQKEAQRAQRAEKKQAESESVFNFLNSSLNLRKTKKHSKHHEKDTSLNYNKESCKDLSKNLLTVGANIKLVEKDISKCKESIKRHEGRDKETVDKLREKLNVLEYQLSQFRNNETQIAKEQSNRSAKKKLEIF